MNDDLENLSALGPSVATPDVDESRAAHIVALGRARLGRGPSMRRRVEALAVAAFALVVLGWAVCKVVELLG